MSPPLRLFFLTLHVISSTGWSGAVAVFLALACWGVGGDLAAMQAASLAMETAALWVIAPLSIVSPLTGLALSLATPWGLMKHYWILFKLLMTIPSTALLFVHLQPIEALARSIRAGAPVEAAAGLRLQMIVDAGAALLVLLIATVLSTYKPRGLTPFTGGR